VNDNEITGTVKTQRVVNIETITADLPWRAKRTGISAYFSATDAPSAQAAEPAKTGGKPLRIS